MKDLADYLRTIPDFPHKGIMFRDVTTLFGAPDGFRMAVDQMASLYGNADADKIAGLEARGFIIGGAVADRLGLGFVPVRKAGKLPGTTISEEYRLEYGTAAMELHDDAITAGEKVVLIDDLIATGGTAAAGIRLIERLGGQVARAGFIIDLPELGGADVVRGLGVPVDVLCAFRGV
ncbi:MAG: adenine phosphoribosyltransferase [Rhodobacteraceae bacterium]|nr:adenine phosphoribosyltransferase [Paracoccaceae bacterium]